MMGRMHDVAWWSCCWSTRTRGSTRGSGLSRLLNTLGLLGLSTLAIGRSALDLPQLLKPLLQLSILCKRPIRSNVGL